MRINYNLDELRKMTTEDLEKVFNEKTNPTLSTVLSKIGRKEVKKKK